MTIRTFNVPLVGMRFRSPAEDVVNCLPAGAELRIELQPENPYDADAIAVYIDGLSETGKAAKAWEMLAKFFSEQGEFEKRELLTDPFMLGFVANSEKTGGKWASTVGSYLKMDGRTGIVCKLGFNAQSLPQLQIEWDSTAAVPEEQATPRSPLEQFDPQKEIERVAPQTSLRKDLDDDIPF